jgi:hypothetical protein
VLLFECACNPVTILIGDSISSTDLENFFRKHKVDNNYAVAIKKHSLGGDPYLVTIHGYPDNISVCERLIAPYNEDSSLSAIPGDYYCEELR